MKARLGVISDTVVTHSQPLAPAAEAFRVLRTNLQFMGLDEPVKSMIVTSATPGEGKSTSVANLAVAFAQGGASVCVVDADLRRPMVAKLFGCENWQGLTTVLIGQASIEQCVLSTSVPGLQILPSGPVPPNPAELLGSAQMTALLASLQETYDVVLIDTPPVLAVTDAAVLASKVGGVVLVARSGLVARKQVSAARDALSAVKAKILGVVLSAVPAEARDGYYTYYAETKHADQGWLRRLRRRFLP